jgi:hypothetical protein
MGLLVWALDVHNLIQGPKGTNGLKSTMEQTVPPGEGSQVLTCSHKHRAAFSVLPEAAAVVGIVEGMAGHIRNHMVVVVGTAVGTAARNLVVDIPALGSLALEGSHLLRWGLALGTLRAGSGLDSLFAHACWSGATTKSTGTTRPPVKWCDEQKRYQNANTQSSFVSAGLLVGQAGRQEAKQHVLTRGWVARHC